MALVIKRPLDEKPVVEAGGGTLAAEGAASIIPDCLRTCKPQQGSGQRPLTRNKNRAPLPKESECAGNQPYIDYFTWHGIIFHEGSPNSRFWRMTGASDRLR